jgi:hypothetical protein
LNIKEEQDLLKPSFVEISPQTSELRPADIPRQGSSCNNTDYTEAFEVKPGGKLS